MTAVMRIASGKILTVSTGQQPQLYLTTDAGKPSPGIGDIVICYDTAKEYICYVASHWMVVTSSNIEEYHNHNGTVDNFTQTGIAGAGTATTNTATHSMDLVSGANNNDYSSYYTKKIYNNSSNPISVSFLVTGLVAGLDPGVPGGGEKRLFLGLRNSFSTWGTSEISFYQDELDTWYIRSQVVGIAGQNTAISPIVNGDLLTIVVVLDYAIFIKNGTIVGILSGNPAPAYIPDGSINLYAGVGLFCTNTGGTDRKISVDMITVKRLL